MASSPLYIYTQSSQNYWGGAGLFNTLSLRLRTLPTPLASLALGIASLGWCLENALPLQGWGQITGAVIAASLLSALIAKFTRHPDSLLQDLQHPVVGSILPTFAMATMVISKTVGLFHPVAAQILWLTAVISHITALISFCYHRAQAFSMHQMVPSWFVPPVGIVVAALTVPGAQFIPLSLVLLTFGMVSCLILLPLMIYRLLFFHEVPDSAKPTIAILAAPASLVLAGYLSVVSVPSLLLCSLLLGIAVLMTVVTYCAFFRLLQLPFSPAYAAFTFPMAIGATALYKLSALLSQYELAQDYADQVYWMATMEIVIATLIITYVSLRYLHYYWSSRPHQSGNHQGVP